MNYYEFLSKKFASSQYAQMQVNGAVTNPLNTNVDTSKAVYAQGVSIFDKASKEDVSKVDYQKIVDNTTENAEKKDYTPLEFILKDFLSIDKVKEAADKSKDGILSAEEAKEYVENLMKKDGNIEELSIDDFEAIVKELGINFDELMQAFNESENSNVNNDQIDNNDYSTQVPEYQDYSEPVGGSSSARSSGGGAKSYDNSPQLTGLDAMSLDELSTEKKTRESKLKDKRNALIDVQCEKTAAIKAAKKKKDKAQSDYLKSLSKDDAVKKFEKPVKENLEAIEKNKEKSNKLAQDLVKNNAKLTDLKSSLTGAQAELSALEDKFKSITGDDEESKKAKVDVEAQISKKKKEVEKIKKDVEKLEQTVKDLEKTKTDLEADKEKLLKTKADLEAQIEKNASEETKAKLKAFQEAEKELEETKEKEVKTSTEEVDVAQKAVDEVNTKITERKTQAIAANGSVEKMVEIAEAEAAKGVHETSENDSPDIARYKHGAHNSNQWCASFTSYCAEQAGLTGKTFDYTASSQSIRRQAEAKGEFAKKNSGYRPKRGDVAIWTNTNDSSHGHVGIVSQVYADGSIDIVEGNSGDRVKKNHYSDYTQIEGRFNGYVKMNEWVA